MQQINANSITDLRPHAAEALADKEWHLFKDLLWKVGEKIGPERAARFYQATGASSDTRPLDERVVAGRRRGTYQCVMDMVRSGCVECKDQSVKCDSREYRMVRPLPEIQ